MKQKQIWVFHTHISHHSFFLFGVTYGLNIKPYLLNNPPMSDIKTVWICILNLNLDALKSS